MSNEERREENIERVIWEALKCFKEFGVDETTILMIANRTGLTTRSINRYFTGRADLIEQAAKKYIDYTFDTVLKELNAVKVNHLTGLAQLLALYEKQYEFFQKDVDATLLIMEMRRYFVVSGADPETKDLIILMCQRPQKRIREALLCGKKDGTIRADLDIEMAQKLMELNFAGLIRMLTTQRKEKPTHQNELDKIGKEYLEQTRRYLMA